MHIHEIIKKEAYLTNLLKLLLDARIIRLFNGKISSTHMLIEKDVTFFDTEENLCREWLSSVYGSYSFYEGFITQEDCEAYIRQTSYPNHQYVIVRFLQYYYAIFYANTQHQQVIGQQVSYYTKNNLFLVAERPPNNLITKERERLPVIPLIFHELKAFDATIEAFHLADEQAKKFTPMPLADAIDYMVLLGVTFKDLWYICDSPYAITRNRALLNMYFNYGHGFTTFCKYTNALAVNPFQRLLYMPKRRVEHFQMDIDDYRTPHRMLPYREVRRYQEFMRTRPFSPLDEQ